MGTDRYPVGGGHNLTGPHGPFTAPTHANLPVLVAREFLQFPHGVFLDALVHRLWRYFNDLSKTALYHRIRRLLLSWEENGLVRLEKVDGLVFAQPLRVDLIFCIANFKPSSSRRPLHPLRREAIKLLKSTKEMEEYDWLELGYFFEEYLDDVNSKIIVLKSVEEGSYLLLPYRHRFKPARLKLLKRKYEEVWSKLEANHKIGIFLTLTVDPKDYDSLLEIAREVPKAFNRLKAWIRKRLKFNPPHVAVYEFQDNGRLHLHVILFGVSRIADKKTELTPELERIGFGKISYIYKIVKKGGRWAWTKGRPRDANLNPKDYLMKYLVKAIRMPKMPEVITFPKPELKVDDLKLAMYWATGKRFFTYSIRIGREERAVKVKVRFFEFIGVFSVLNVPDHVLERSMNPWLIYLLATGPGPPPS